MHLMLSEISRETAMLKAADSDPNCGGAFDAAIIDTLFGYEYNCSQTNPNNPVATPTVTPVCG